ncbi:MAG TPA: phosphatidylglycerophosphatase A [Nitrospiria bacterium]
MATGFGAGYAPVASGTAGSIVGLGLVFLLYRTSPSWIVYLLVVFLVFLAGVYVAGRFEHDSGEKDSGRIVIDEIAGMLLAAFLVPPELVYLVGAFLLFRIFDIFKPPPARWAERSLPGGWGVMMDDMVAGLYSNLVIQGIRLLAGPS